LSLEKLSPIVGLGEVLKESYGGIFGVEMKVKAATELS